ncbi:uncharacterized protein LOC119688586 [Teleopsis dalmanni]|uniref:uncharacterized protein LOC119665805 n=1 Tax=Teleopsis dalmanni TaxID=139649 RepID=UPI0018CFBDD6|nr:uncharacterized protein LOC119665805 [Teleopsis dalmanni]XP_037932640.1 uncharacterized protein LOC119667424 [Teleopsis dalmanni]XP_037959186.1 uncharacterized protein LOC119688585 [Teleopsis dalmanni]XP_037959187.1 uncharacterized protein LOC119688586 [Teleopsis dalmanni]
MSMTEANQEINSPNLAAASAPSQAEQGQSVEAMGVVKLPPFLHSDPELWFTQIDGLLHVNRITSDVSKYYTVITALDANTLGQVADIAKKPPVSDKYATLKEELIRRFGESKQKQLIKLLTNLELSDKRPSQLLRDMRNLAGTNISEDALSTLWAQRLPSNVRCILSACNAGSLESMAELADRIMDNLPTPQFVMAATTGTHFNQSSSPLEARVLALETAVQQIISSLGELTMQLKPSSRDRSTDRRHEKRDRKQSNMRNKVCSYHTRFGSRAFKCTPPCEFSKAAENHSSTPTAEN